MRISRAKLPIDLTKRPLVLAILLMMAALIISSYLPPILTLINILKVGLVILNFILVWAYKKRLKSRKAILSLLIFLLSFLYLQNLELDWKQEGLKEVIGERISLRAMVIDVEVKERGIEYLLSDIRANDLSSKRRIILSNWEGEKELSYGDLIEVDTRLSLAPQKRNPGSFSYRNYLKGENIYARANISRDNGLRVLGNNGGRISKLVWELRLRMEKSIDSYFESPYSEILKALLLGKNDLPQEVDDNFRELGLSHILVISGFHMGLISYLIALLCQKFNLSKGPTLFISLSTLLFYLALTGFGLSSTRAVILIGLILVAKYLGRRVDLYNLLAGAGIIILLIDPRSLFKVSFQLSFAAVLSISYLGPIIKNLLPSRLARLREVLGATIAAQLGLLPILAYYFYEVSFLGIVANPLLMPLISILIWLALPFLIIATLGLPVIPELLAIFMEFILHIILGIVNLLASNLTLSLLVGRPNFILIILYYLILYYSCKFLKPTLIPYTKDYPRYTKVIVVALITFLIVQVGFDFNSELKLVFFDVGNGDAIYFETATGRKGIIDGGVYGNEVISYLRSRGIRSLDFIFISHFHLDHAGGIPGVIENFEVENLIYPPTLEENRLEVEILELAKDRGIGLYQLTGGDRVGIDYVEIDVLGPTYPLIGESSANNNSLVFILNYGDFKALFTGDLEIEGEKRMLEQYNNFELESTVLKVGHHGSATSTDDKFLREVGPQLAVIQVGNNNYGHPSPLVISSLEGKGVNVLRTEEGGAVTIFSDGRSYRYRTFR